MLGPQDPSTAFCPFLTSMKAGIPWGYSQRLQAWHPHALNTELGVFLAINSDSLVSADLHLPGNYSGPTRRLGFNISHTTESWSKRYKEFCCWQVSVSSAGLHNELMVYEAMMRELERSTSLTHDSSVPKTINHGSAHQTHLWKGTEQTSVQSCVSGWWLQYSTYSSTSTNWKPKEFTGFKESSCHH